MDKPNIVFLHVDQMHHDVIAAYGNPHVYTPNMDRLVREGTSFMSSYCSMPQCCPSRACWYTGRMSKEHGVMANPYPIDPNIPDLGQWLRECGYDCAYTGKWHVTGRDLTGSFDVLHRGHGMGELQDSDVARTAVAYIQNREDDRPFFLSVGFLNPHDCCFPAMPHGGPAKYGLGAKLKDKLPPLPGNFDYDYAKGGRPNVRNWSLQDWQYYIYVYHRMVEMVDCEIGRVYDTLRRSHYADNTLFIFASDHGDGLAYHSKTSKGFMEEEAYKVPTIVCWPGRVPQGVQDTGNMVSGVDIAATICDYAGAPPLPKTTIARSWRPLLEGEEVDWREYLVGETSVGRVAVAVRTDRYKSIMNTETTRFYDMQDDPLETRDLSDEPAYADLIRQHRDHFREYLNRIEVFPEPEEGRNQGKRGNLYREYIEWYESVKREV
ncbi:MAG: hypothetical protein CL914_09685 [Deltaproteobacteria bacterium]|nr:hypothetical protein [Deltaproteobacteria bacterium]